MSNEENQEDSGIAVKDQQKVEIPKMYQVILHNDDYTTMEFVIHVLKKFFKMNDADAYDVMLKVHHDGRGRCGIFTKEIAQMKVTSVNNYAKKNGHPLKSSFESCD